MKRKLTITVVLIIASMLFVLNAAALPLVRITKLTTDVKPHYWRLTFTLSAPVNFNLFTLKQPNRVVLDVNNAVLAQSLPHAAYVTTPVQAIRWAYHSNNVLRMVFAMNYAVTAKAHMVAANNKHGPQLVVELYGKRMKVVGFGWPQSKAQPTAKPVAIAPKKPAHLRNIVVVIDPGHGGKDPGATGPNGTHEKNVVLAISKDLQRMINQQPGYRALLTRRGDYYLTLRQRLAIARRDKADLFVAIHADAWKNTTAQGASVFALSSRGATSEAARWLAKRENASELMGGVNLSHYNGSVIKSVLINLQQTATIRSSLKVGANLIGELKRVTRLHHGRVEQAAFVVLKSPDIPSLLVETGFLSNPQEERRLTTPSYQQRLAKAIEEGVLDYFSQQPPRGTKLAAKAAHIS